MGNTSGRNGCTMGTVYATLPEPCAIHASVFFHLSTQGLTRGVVCSMVHSNITVVTTWEDVEASLATLPARLLDHA
jgi:hypothetical protein